MKKISFDVKDVLPQLTQVASIIAAKNAMPILSSNEFPIHKIEKDDLCEFDLHPKNLFSYIKKVSFATNNDKLRPVLNSIHFDFFADNMIIVATDGQRLAKITDGNGKEHFW